MGALTPKSVAYKAKKREEALHAEREKGREAREAREEPLQKGLDELAAFDAPDAAAPTSTRHGPTPMSQRRNSLAQRRDSLAQRRNSLGAPLVVETPESKQLREAVCLVNGVWICTNSPRTKRASLLPALVLLGIDAIARRYLKQSIEELELTTKRYTEALAAVKDRTVEIKPRRNITEKMAAAVESLQLQVHCLSWLLGDKLRYTSQCTKCAEGMPDELSMSHIEFHMKWATSEGIATPLSLKRSKGDLIGSQYRSLSHCLSLALAALVGSHHLTGLQ